MFSAVSNLGAGGTQDVTLSDTANGVLYGFFALTGLVSGGINNRASPVIYPLSCPDYHQVLGPRFTLFIGYFGLCSLCRFFVVVSTTPS